MKSIDNLREYVASTTISAWTQNNISQLIDAIEREVEELRDRDYRNGREDAEGAVEFADRLKASATNRADVTLFGVDYTALPVGADGVPIHVGDVMDNTHKDGFRAKRVIGICLHDGGKWTVEVDEERLRWHRTDKLRHHHAPTVEDVLREMLSKYDELRLGPSAFDPFELMAEYAAKLRLAGDE